VLRRLLLWFLACVAFGALLGLLRLPLGVAWAIALVAPLTVGLAYRRHVLRHAPQRYREIVQRHFDPEAGPPARSAPVAEPLLDRWFAGADGSRDVAGLLAPDFRFTAVGRRRPIGRAMFVRAMRNGAKWMGESREQVLAVLADPSEPDVLWVKQHSVIQPPDGREIRSAQWSRWTLTPDRERIRAIEVVAFTAPPVPV
jgi:hypothetical protein